MTLINLVLLFGNYTCHCQPPRARLKGEVTKRRNQPFAGFSPIDTNNNMKSVHG